MVAVAVIVSPRRVALRRVRLPVKPGPSLVEKLVPEVSV